jgi:hypothetical protein
MPTINNSDRGKHNDTVSNGFNLPHDRDKQRSLMSIVTNLRILWNAKKAFGNWKLITLSGRVLLLHAAQDTLFQFTASCLMAITYRRPEKSLLHSTATLQPLSTFVGQHLCTNLCTLDHILTFWRRNYFFLILAHPVYKMLIIQEPNTLELRNKLHFEEKNTKSIYHV